MWHEWGEKTNVYRLLVGKPEGKRPLGRPRRRWIDKIKMGILEVGLRLVETIRNLLSVCGKGLLAPSPTPQAGGSPLVVCPRLLIQRIRS
jgi:hypothetical protein